MTLVPTTCFNCEAACGLVAYVDKETNIISVSDLYDQGNELWKPVMISLLWAMARSTSSSAEEADSPR